MKKYFSLTLGENNFYNCLLYKNKVETDYVAIDDAVYFVSDKEYSKFLNVQTLFLIRVSYKDLNGLSLNNVTELCFDVDNDVESFNIAMANTLLQKDKIIVLKKLNNIQKDTFLKDIKKIMKYYE